MFALEYMPSQLSVADDKLRAADKLVQRAAGRVATNP